MKTYAINEWFYSLQGEGMRSGTPNLFLRFSGCNLQCTQEEMGFDCDTEFSSFRKWTSEEIVRELKATAKNCEWIILTGGEPTLQIDDEILNALKNEGYKLAIETNGLKPVPSQIDWITVSPKTAEHTIKQLKANEVKYVRSYGQGIPKTSVQADYYLISPAFEAGHLPPRNLEWCIQLVKENPPWRLSLQTHKFMNIR